MKMITLANFRKPKNEKVEVCAKSENEEYDFQSAKVSKILPNELYKDVARIIGLDENIQEKLNQKRNYKKMFSRASRLVTAFKSQVKDSESSENINSSYVEPPTPRDKGKGSIVNPYYDFFQKTEREQVQWESKYLPPETEMEKGLIRRADDLTNRICSKFCKYMNDLGGYESPLFKTETVKKMFEIEFNTHIAKSIAICPRQLKSVPESIAHLGNYKKDFERNALRKEIAFDIDAERRSPKIFGFNSRLQPSDIRIPPKNNTKQKWFSDEKKFDDITTMQNVFEGAAMLKSVQDFSQHLLDHRQIRRPKYSKEIGMLDQKKLNELKHIHKYNEVNKLSPINLKEQLAGKERRKASIPTVNIKILK